MLLFDIYNIAWYTNHFSVIGVLSIWRNSSVVGWFVYSCCSHLDLRTSVKRFISLQFLNLRHSVGLLGRAISPSQGRYLTRRPNKYRQTSMPRVGLEPTISAFERAKAVHAVDRAATVIAQFISTA
jgi:hypothetical protein